MNENKHSLRERIDEIIERLTNEKFSTDVNKFDSGIKSAGARFRKEARELANLLRISVKFSLGKDIPAPAKEDPIP